MFSESKQQIHVPNLNQTSERRMLIQLGLRLLLANAWTQEKEVDKMKLWLVKQHEIWYYCDSDHRQWPVTTTTSQIKLLHSAGEGAQDYKKRWTLCL